MAFRLLYFDSELDFQIIISLPHSLVKIWNTVVDIAMLWKSILDMR